MSRESQLAFRLALFLMLPFYSFLTQPISSNLPQTGLFACYPFNRNADDESMKNSHGVVTGAKLTTDLFGSPNSAYYFNGKNTFIEVHWPNAFYFSKDESFTLNVWIQPDSLNPDLPFGQSQRVFWKYSCPHNIGLDVAGIQFTDGPNIRKRSNPHNVNLYHSLPEVCKG